MKTTDLITWLESMADANLNLGEEARSRLADLPLTADEIAEAERVGLSPLEYRLIKELWSITRLYNRGVINFKKAENVLAGGIEGNKIKAPDRAKKCPDSRSKIRRQMIREINEPQDYKLFVARYLSRSDVKLNRTFFHTELGKQKIMEDVDKRAARIRSKNK
jgi:hypothetical protein